MTGPIGGALGNPNASHSINGRTVYTIQEVAWIANQFWKPFVKSHGQPAAVIAVCIAMEESGGNIMAHNDNYKRGGRDDSYGLWQINMLGGLGSSRRAKYQLPDNAELLDPVINAKVAYGESYLGGNWKAWSTYNDGSYKKWLWEAANAVANPKKPGNVGQGKVNTQFTPWEAVKDWVGGGLLRTAGFIGGGALIIGAAVMVAKKG